MKRKWGAAFQIAAVYVGTVVGAGFATGKEIVEFFTRFGFIGLVGILMSGYILIFQGSKLMRLSARIGAKSYQEFNIYLFGGFFGTIINFLMLFMLLGVTAVMLAGAGAVFEEQLRLSKDIGILLTIVLSIVVMVVGTKGLFAVNTFVVPLMIAFSFLMLILSMRLPNFSEQILYIPFAEDGWKAVIAPFSYTALNLGLAQAVLVPIAAEINDDKIVKWGGILGGTALTLILLSSHLTLVMLPDPQAFEIPMATILKNLAPGIYFFYILVIYGEIFTTVIGNVFGIERQIRTHYPIPSTIIVGVIFVIVYFVSFVNYGTLLSYLYPLFGYITIAFIVLLWMKPIDEGKQTKG